ncbi:MAG: Rieske (2Fe-2S) protein [Candidatus Dormibacteraeota bacterium]|nr:Rieske (2Fe-2S) protein [Candidatus Dormibacteraeota bacterium]
MRFVVGAVEDIPDGARKIVEVAGRSIGVFNLGGEFFALRNRCPHQGGPLCEGRRWSAIEAAVPGQVRASRPGEILSCAWHGWEFDIRTGQSWCDPARLRVRSYDVSVQAGESLAGELDAAARVPGPYVAETYAVSVDGRYVVVEVDP